MKKTLLMLCCLIAVSGWAQNEGALQLAPDQSPTDRPLKTTRLPEHAPIDELLDNWHKAAATSNFDAYFGALSSDAVFVGTDASEVWTNKEFQRYAKPYFDKGKGWKFMVISRNIHHEKGKELAWFDELLETDMKLCRGSGVLRMEDGKWKIVHYVLSMTVPNENVTEVVKIKTENENLFLKKNKRR